MRAGPTLLAFALLALILVPVACRPRDDAARDSAAANGDDPLLALRSAVMSARYAHAFWRDQARRQTALWDSAYAFCAPYWHRDDGSRPNCGAVYTANFFESGARVALPEPTRVR